MALCPAFTFVIRAYLRGKRYREALQDLSMSIQLDPDNAQKIQQRAK